MGHQLKATDFLSNRSALGRKLTRTREKWKTRDQVLPLLTGPSAVFEVSEVAGSSPVEEKQSQVWPLVERESNFKKWCSWGFQRGEGEREGEGCFPNPSLFLSDDPPAPHNEWPMCTLGRRPERRKNSARFFREWMEEKEKGEGAVSCCCTHKKEVWLPKGLQLPSPPSSAITANLILLPGQPALPMLPLSFSLSLSLFSTALFGVSHNMQLSQISATNLRLICIEISMKSGLIMARVWGCALSFLRQIGLTWE